MFTTRNNLGMERTTFIAAVVWAAVAIAAALTMIVLISVVVGVATADTLTPEGAARAAMKLWWAVPLYAALWPIYVFAVAIDRMTKWR